MSAASMERLHAELIARWPEIRLTVWLRDIPDAAALAALEAELAGSAAPVALIGWRSPERNLDFPAALLARLLALARGQGVRLDAFLRAGGVEGVAARSGRAVALRRPVWGGAAALLVLAGGRL